MTKNYKILLASLTMPLLLSACFMGDRVCIQQCRQTKDGERVIFAPYRSGCNTGAGLAVAKEQVTSCHQCLDNRHYVGGVGGMGLQLPADDSLADTVKGLNLVEACAQQDRDISIPRFIAARQGRHGPERYGDDYTEPEAIGNGMYVMHNRFTESYNQDIFFYRNPEGHHVFVALCYSPGFCSSNSNPVKDAPYVFGYSINKPQDTADFIKVHEHVTRFVDKVYADSSRAAEEHRR